jgi:hypothetical protein
MTMRPVMTHAGPLLGRIWTGRTRAELADEYLAYNYEHGLLEIERMSGCVGVQQFRTVNGPIAEIRTISYWTSPEAMAAMHPGGGDLLRPAHLPLDREYLLGLPEAVELTHLHVNDWRP